MTPPSDPSAQRLASPDPTPTPTSAPTRSKLPLVLLSVMVLGAALAMSLANAVGRPLIHDEHQFVSPGALLAQRGMLPYVDYVYFHMPYLTFLYALVFQVTDHLLLGARLCSALFGWVTIATIFIVALNALRGRGALVRVAFATAVGSLVVFNPLFRQAHGLTWNHDGGALFTLLGLLALCRAFQDEHHCKRHVFRGGVCLAISTGIRLSYATMAIPFALLMLLGPRRERGPSPWGRVGWLAIGGVAGSLPILVIMTADLSGFFFGNLGYPLLNTQWYGELGVTKAMTLPTKLDYLMEDVVPEAPTLALLLLALLGACVRGSWRDLRTGGPGLLTGASLLCLPFALGGAFAPSPSWPQYYVAVIPFLGLIVGTGVGRMIRENETVATGLIAVVLVGGAVAATYGHEKYHPLDLLTRYEDWEPPKVHEVGRLIGERVGDGVVFTEAPTYALEGGCMIYLFNATGPFATRTGHLLAAEKRAELGMKIYKELPAVMAVNPPEGVLAGPEGWMPGPVRNRAKGLGFMPFTLPNGHVIYSKAGAVPRAPAGATPKKP